MRNKSFNKVALSLFMSLVAWSLYATRFEKSFIHKILETKDISDHEALVPYYDAKSDFLLKNLSSSESSEGSSFNDLLASTEESSGNTDAEDDNAVKSRSQGQDERNNGTSSVQVPIAAVEFAGKNRTKATLDSNLHQANEAISMGKEQLKEMNTAQLVVEKASTIIDYHPKTSALTQCHLEMERQLQRVQFEMNQAWKPMLYSVKIINDLFHVFFSVYDLTEEHKVQFVNGNATCNGVEGATFKPTGRLDMPGLLSDLILVCPPQINASHTILSSVSVTAEHIGVNDTGTDVTVYNTSLLDKCEREDIRHHARLGNATKRGIHAVFVGDRQKAFEWATYHHMIGFDHVWLYVNEDWNDGEGLIHRDYITWIPYNFHDQYPELGLLYKKRREGNPMEVFRIPGQNCALWRAKRMGLDWFAPMDFDEYIQFKIPHIGSGAFNASMDLFGPGLSPSGIDTLPKFLSAFKERRGEEYVGIIMNSIFFGKGPDEEEDTKKQFLMDYTWRQRGDPATFRFTRYKMIVNVTVVEGIQLHYITSTSTHNYKQRKVRPNLLQFNHYKRPKRGVYRRKRKQVWDREGIVIDTSFRDEYREEFMKHLNRSIG